MNPMITFAITWIGGLAACAIAGAQAPVWDDAERTSLRELIAAYDPQDSMPIAERGTAALYARHGRALLEPIAAMAAPGSGDELAVRAALVLAWLGDRRAIPGLAVALEGETPIARTALGYLAGFGAREHLPAIGALIARKRLVRDAAEALGRLGDPRAVPILLAALGYADDDARKIVPIELARLGAHETVPTLVDLMSDRATWVRKAAAHAVGALGTVEHASRIEPLLSDPEEWVRLEAVVALARLGAPGSIPRLMSHLSALDRPLTNQALAALSRLPLEEHVRRLAERGHGRHRDRVLLELVRLGTPAARDAVANELDRLEPWARVEVAGALLAAGDPRGEAPLIAALREPDTERSRADLAAVLLARAGAPTALEHLLAAIEHPDDAELRVAAAYATSLLSPERLPVSELEAMIERTGASPNSGWHLERAWAIRRGGPEGCAALVRLAGNRWNTEALLLGITGLEAVGAEEPAAVAFLLDSLDDHRSAYFAISVADIEGPVTIYRAAARALARIAGASAPPGPLETPEAESAAWRPPPPPPAPR